VLATQLLEQELAVWRSADGTLNVWADRCPHRGMRLTLGANLGEELRCAYHGYRFASGTARCNAVPAHPDSAPPQSLRVRTYPVRLRDGLIWTRLESADEAPAAEGDTATAPSMALYGLAVHAPALRVAESLAHYRFRPSAALEGFPPDGVHCSGRSIDAYGVECVASAAEHSATVRFWIQPLQSHRTQVHARLIGALADAQRLPTLRHHAAQLSQWRVELERSTRDAVPA